MCPGDEGIAGRGCDDRRGTGDGAWRIVQGGKLWKQAWDRRDSDIDIVNRETN